MPIGGLSIGLGDEMSVENGTSIPYSNLSKNSLGIFYYAVIEEYETVIWEVGFVKVNQNISNFLTNILSLTDENKEVEKWIWSK